jgi:hypothetical protein
MLRWTVGLVAGLDLGGCHIRPRRDLFPCGTDVDDELLGHPNGAYV